MPKMILQGGSHRVNFFLRFQSESFKMFLHGYSEN
jgi:hypothetical protein